MTIAMPVYNGAGFLRPAIDSVLAQSFVGFELVITDDGSSDASPGIIAEYARRDRRVVVVFGEHGGIAAATNRMLAAARGEYFAPMDQDDVSLQERLAREVAFLDANPNIGVVGTAARTIDAAGRELKSIEPLLSPQDVAKAMHTRCAVLHPSSMMRTAVLRDVGGYREFLPYAQDYDLFLRMVERKALANIPDVLLHKRTHPRQVTGSASNRPAQIVAGAMVYMSHMSQKTYGADIFREGEALTVSAARFIDTYLADHPRPGARALHHFGRFLRFAPLEAPMPRRLAHPYGAYWTAAVSSGSAAEAIRSSWYLASYFLHWHSRHRGLLATNVYAGPRGT